MANNPFCSIDMEPRTLKEGQLSHAREVAVDIIQKMEPNEASTVFREGLKPVISMKEVMKIVEKGESEVSLKSSDDDDDEIRKTTCHCLCNSAMFTESPDQQVIKLKEPHSAPF